MGLLLFAICAILFFGVAVPEKLPREWPNAVLAVLSGVVGAVAAATTLVAALTLLSGISATPEREERLAMLERRQEAVVAEMTETADLDYPEPSLAQIVNAVEGKILAGDASANDLLTYHRELEADISNLREEMYVQAPRARYWLYFGN